MTASADVEFRTFEEFVFHTAVVVTDVTMVAVVAVTNRHRYTMVTVVTVTKRHRYTTVAVVTVTNKHRFACD